MGTGQQVTWLELKKTSPRGQGAARAGRSTERSLSGLAKAPSPTYSLTPRNHIENNSVVLWHFLQHHVFSHVPRELTSGIILTHTENIV